MRSKSAALQQSGIVLKMAVSHKTVLFCLLLAVVQRTVVGQDLRVGNDRPCQAPDIDPDPNSDEDNLSCPHWHLDQSVVQCYPRDELCNANPFCSGGSDEGANLSVALDCCELANTSTYVTCGLRPH